MYILSTANRVYVAIEPVYGKASAVTPADRVPIQRLEAHQAIIPVKRLDKTGSRTFAGSQHGRRRTAFQTSAYLTSSSDEGAPPCGPLFEAALGGTRGANNGLTIAGTQDGNQLKFASPHGLKPGDGTNYRDEIRFVSTIPDPLTITLNAPFTNLPSPGSVLGNTVSYNLSTMLPSISIYDYWTPTTTVSRILTGAAVDTLEIIVNGDYHELTFAGPASDLIDSSSFAPGSAGLSAFPAEPSPDNLEFPAVPGHLGQVWLGDTPTQFLTLATARITLRNNLNVRADEFGSSFPMCVVPGPRQVTTSFSVFVQDDAQTIALYRAAKQRTPISVMLQLGQQSNQLMGIYLPKVIPEIPMYKDDEPRLQWEFTNNVAQGSSDDEIYIAFA